MRLNSNILPLTIIGISALAMGSCRHSPHATEAKERGIKAAEALLATDPTDTLAMQASVLEAKASQSEYALIDDSVAVEIFDEAFRDYVTAHNAKLAAEMFNDKSK